MYSWNHRNFFLNFEIFPQFIPVRFLKINFFSSLWPSHRQNRDPRENCCRKWMTNFSPSLRVVALKLLELIQFNSRHQIHQFTLISSCRCLQWRHWGGGGLIFYLISMSRPVNILHSLNDYYHLLFHYYQQSTMHMSETRSAASHYCMPTSLTYRLPLIVWVSWTSASHGPVTHSCKHELWVSGVPHSPYIWRLQQV